MDILDCTMRDGGYENNWEFSMQRAREIYNTNIKCGVNYCEVGFRRRNKENGVWYYTPESIVNETFSDIISPKCKLAVMAQMGTFDMDDFVPKKDSLISMVRVLIAYHCGDVKDDSVLDEKLLDETIEVCKKIKDMGYEVSMNIGRIDKISDSILTKICTRITDNIDYLYIADTYGSLGIVHLRNILKLIKQSYSGKIGFHGHDNLKNSSIKTIDSFYNGVSMVDVTYGGIGRCAGNADATIILVHLLRNGFKNIDNVIESAIYTENNVKPYKQDFAQILTGILGMHVNYAKLVEHMDIREMYITLNNVEEKSFYTELVLRKCPICSCKTHKTIFNEIVHNFDNHVLGNLISIKQCTNCKFLFSDNMRCQAHYDLYYNMNTRYLIRLSDPNIRYVQTADIIRSFIKPGDSVIDIGCGPGNILDILKHDYTCYGADPSKNCVEFFEAIGIHGICSTLENVTGEYDMVVMSHVLEHIYDLDKSIAKLSSLCKKYIYIEVPDASKYYTNTIVPFLDFNCEHINHFTSASLIRLFDNHGLQCVQLSHKIIDGCYPAIYAVFEKKVDASLDLFIEKSTHVLTKMKDCVGDRRVNLLGVGVLGIRLANSFNIDRIFDDNVNVQGMTIMGKTIEPFDASDDTPLITSNYYIPTNKGINNINIFNIKD